jgi:hypothetical protein
MPKIVEREERQMPLQGVAEQWQLCATFGDHTLEH